MKLVSVKNKMHIVMCVCVLAAVFCAAGCSSFRKEVDPYANSIRPSILGNWVLVRMQDVSGELFVADGMTLCLPEEPRNAVHGCAGVNLYNGTADITDKTFKAGALGTTMMAGLPDAMEAEQNYLRLIALCNTIAVETIPAENPESLAQTRLILSNKAEQIRLEFVK